MTAVLRGERAQTLPQCVAPRVGVPERPAEERRKAEPEDGTEIYGGFANTRAAARQLVAHGHVKVNGRKVNIPSFGLKVNDIVEIKNSNAARQLATRNLESAASRAVPDWLNLDKEALKGVVMRVPTRDEIQPIANEQAVVEFYSR